jgi:peptidoglycan hydrolase CwlO-like protein
MFNPEELWKKFTKQPWWVKVLAFIPLLIVMFIGVALFVVSKQELKVNQMAIDRNKKKTDKKIKDFSESHRQFEKEVKKVQNEQDKIQKEIENVKKEHVKNVDRISNANGVDELLRITGEIRAANRNRTGVRGESSD